VIAITLNFKSIEAARQALLDIPSSSLAGGPEPEAVQETKHAPKAQKAAATATSPDTAAKAAASDKKTSASGTSPTASSAAASGASEGNAAAGSSVQEATAAQTASSGEASKSVDYPTLQKAVFALAGKSREAAAAVAGSFGVKTFKELPEAKWADALAAVTDKLTELEAA
jgi:hypothetical protein